MNFPSHLKKLRTAAGLSMYELGERSGLPRTVIWKAEHGRTLPRPETLAQIATGLGIAKGSKAWNELYASWSGDRTGNSLTSAALAGAITTAKTLSASKLKAFSASLAKLSQEDLAQVQKAITRPSVLAGIRTLNALYESKS